jgi:hypothetical protein
MAFPNTSVTDIIATTIESRTKKVADNVTKNNALLARLMEKGNKSYVTGGSQILEELSFAENGNGQAYSGYDLLPVAAQDVISAATFQLKQYAVPVVISGLETLQNTGNEEIIPLLSARLKVAEGTMKNLISQGIYGDGTGFGGKALVGLDAMNPATLTSSQATAYGGITPATGTITAFWRSYCEGSITLPTASTVQGIFNRFWAQLVRGSDRPDLIVVDNNYWSPFVNSLQLLQRFTGTETAKLGFPSQKFFDADVVLDGGIGGFAYTNSTTGGTAYFCNTDYMKWRPHRDRDFVNLSPNRRYSVNQDAEVAILAFAGALTCSGRKFQGRAFTT